MKSLDEFLAIQETYKKSVDFVIIYINEAHPMERDNLNGNYKINSHANMDERISAAKILEDEIDLVLDQKYTLLVDLFDNEAEDSYAPLPERLYIVNNGNVAYIGGMGPMWYDLNEMEVALKKLL